MRVLITGGAGYIGSHTAKQLARSGYEPVVYDNLSTGHGDVVRWGPFIEGDLADRQQIRAALAAHDITGCIHFAANAYVGESMENPHKYFQNNVANTVNLLGALLEAGVTAIVFSSSCTVYGLPELVPIAESHPRRPISPYGESKLFVEKALHWYGQAYSLQSVALRYFNAAGADPDGELGEDHDPEPHLIPRAILASLGAVPPLEVFGTDYPTPDGTAVRDYIHVTDLARAHVLALEYLLGGGESTAVNLGTGRGYSVLEVLDSVERMTGRTVPRVNAPRRPGDPPALIAEPALAEEILGWRAEIRDLDRIIETAGRRELACRAPEGEKTSEPA